MQGQVSVLMINHGDSSNNKSDKNFDEVVRRTTADPVLTSHRLQRFVSAYTFLNKFRHAGS
jgi:hypothetical protein